jgi:hypothetical protein
VATVREFAVLKDEERKGEEVRLNLEEYKGKRRVDLRLFVWNDEVKSFLPTRRGLVLSKKLAIQLRNALLGISESELHDLLAGNNQNAAAPPKTLVQGTLADDLRAGG